MNLASVDLNLLVALDALLAEAHVGRAASKVGLSQPAMSHALRRLRVVLSDPLLVRVGANMELTERAQSLRKPLAVALEQVRGLFSPERFDPATSHRRFRLMVPDVTLDILLTPLVRTVLARAPGVQLEVIPWQEPSLYATELARTVDLAISCQGRAFAGFRRQRLYRDRDALAVRKGHPLIRRLPKLDVFLAAQHIAVIGRGAREDLIDSWLRRAGHERRVAVVTPNYLQALHLAAHSDLVAFLPRRMINAVGKPLGVRSVEPPLDPGVDEQYLFYPAQAQRDPGAVWLRSLVVDICRSWQP